MENKKTILVVEDDLALQEAFKLKLGKEKDIRILTASTGEEALAVLEKESPDLVTLDILLPKMNGIEVLRAMRKDPRFKNILVVIVSVSGSNEVIKEALELGIVDFLVKSDYKLDDLIKKIKGFLSLL